MIRVLLLSILSPAAAFVLPARAPVRAARATATMSMSPFDEAGMASRRALLDSAFAAALGLSVLDVLPVGADAPPATVDYAAVRDAVKKMVKDNPDRGPTVVRLAWHLSGTYDKNSNNGGSYKGTIRLKKELAYGANAGLAKAVAWMEPIHSANPGISYGDLYTLAGVAAIEQMGGPKVPWRAGRIDDASESAVLEDGRLPAADKGNPTATAQGLRDTFYKMGFNDQEIVALSGAHALGRCHTDASGYDGPWTPAPTLFTNAYFTLLKNLKWTPRKWTGPFQYQDASGSLMMLPSDLALIEDPTFKKYVDVYADDGKKFYKDFAKVFQKLEELGCKGLYEVTV